MPGATTRRVLLLASLALTGAHAAHAKVFARGSISITHPWAAPAVTEAAALFMGLVNNGPDPDRLIAASTPVAKTAILRSYDGTPREYYQLWPQRPVVLAPGRRYIALRNLTRPLALDDTFPVMLHFAKAGSFIVTAIVEAGLDDASNPSG